jgi:hypothetical protein
MTCVSWMCILPWLLGRGEKIIQTSMSWMNVYPGLIVKEDEYWYKKVYLLGSWNNAVDGVYLVQ